MSVYSVHQDNCSLPTWKSVWHSTEYVKLHQLCNTFQFMSISQNIPHAWPAVYLEVIVSNTGIIGRTGVGIGDNDIIWKAQVQAAVVGYEIRNNYDKIYKGKMILEIICLLKVLYGMEITEVYDKVIGEIEAIQIGLGRVILGASNRVGGEAVSWELGWLPGFPDNTLKL